MYTYTETHDNITIIKTTILDINYTCGMIEKGYGNIYLVTGLNDQIIKDGDNNIFTDFEKAYNAIVKTFKREFDL